MAISKEEKKKLISKCRICDIDLENGFMSEAMKIAKCGSKSQPVNYGQINKIVKENSDPNSGDIFFRTWKSICLLWKSYFGKKFKDTENTKFIVRPLYSTVEAFEIRIVNLYQQQMKEKLLYMNKIEELELEKEELELEKEELELEKEELELEKHTTELKICKAKLNKCKINLKKCEDNLQTSKNRLGGYFKNFQIQLEGLEKQFIGSVEREKRKEEREIQRLEKEAKFKGLTGTQITDYIQEVKNRKQGFGWTTSVDKIKSVMKNCLTELMEKCNGSDAKTYLNSQKNITKEYATEIMNDTTNGPIILRMSGRDYLNKLSEATTIGKSAEILGGNEGDKNSKDLEILFNGIKTNDGKNLRDSLRIKVALLS